MVWLNKSEKFLSWVTKSWASLYSFAGPAITKYHSMGSLNHKNLCPWAMLIYIFLAKNPNLFSKKLAMKVKCKFYWIKEKILLLTSYPVGLIPWWRIHSHPILMTKIYLEKLDFFPLHEIIQWLTNERKVLKQIDQIKDSDGHFCSWKKMFSCHSLPLSVSYSPFLSTYL